jgi:hypothetical protein
MSARRSGASAGGAGAGAVDGRDADDGADAEAAPGVELGAAGGVDFAKCQDDRPAGFERQAGGGLIIVGGRGGGVDHDYEDAGGIGHLADLILGLKLDFGFGTGCSPAGFG